VADLFGYYLLGYRRIDENNWVWHSSSLHLERRVVHCSFEAE
jgi:hypothetical protein